MINILKRGISYLKYKKVRSLLLIVVYTIISLLLLLFATINSTIDNYYKNLDNINGISVSINPKMKKPESREVLPSQNKNDRINGDKKNGFMFDMGASQLSDEQQEKLSKLKYIKDTTKSASTMATSDKLELVTYNNESTSNYKMGPSITSDSLMVSANSNFKVDSDFSNGSSELESGSLPNADNEVVISNNFATLNSLSLGDSITVKINNTKYTLKVSGLFKDTSSSNELMRQMMAKDNTLYITYKAIEDESDIMTNTVYYLDSTDSFKQFKEDYFRITNLNANDFEVTINDEDYQNTIKPLQQLQNTFTTIMIVTIVITIVIIGVIFYIVLKERNYEIGVLYAISESKRNIVIQFIIENTILMSIAFVIALAITLCSSQIMINGLLQMDIFKGLSNSASRMGGGMMIIPDGDNPMKSTNSLDVDVNYSILSFILVYIVTNLSVIIITIISLSQTLNRRISEIIGG